jgi:hypothetical protein
VKDWNAATLEETLRAYSEQQGVSAGKVIHPLRVALTGQLLGKERVLRRIDGALLRLRNTR